jgi:hypothetical protein
MITTHNNNILSYNKNNNIYNTNNTIFYLNTLNYKRKNNIYNTYYYINTCGWTQLEVGLRRLLTHLGVGRATRVWRARVQTQLAIFFFNGFFKVNVNFFFV